MPTPKMSITERRKYLMIQQSHYRKANRKEQSRLLNEIVAVTGLNRKYLIHLLGSDLKRKRRKRQRGRTYGSDVQAALALIAKSLDYVCGKRMKPVLLDTADNLRKHGHLTLTPELEQALSKISASTIDRLLSGRQLYDLKLPRSGPSSGKTNIQRAIPVATVRWDEPEPGHFEVDLVSHGGPNPCGDFIYTLQMIDVATGWSERQVILGKSHLVVADAFRVLQHRLPFPIKEIHTDNGSEFLNDHLYRFWSNQQPQVLLSRSRLGIKNDSRFVEQKNSSLVRAYLGKKRYDTVAQTWAINYLYELMGLFYNLFQPVMRLKEKLYSLDERGERQVKRRHDQAATPLARLCASKILEPEQEESIKRLQSNLDLLALRDLVAQQLFEVKTLSNAEPGEIQNVYDTLSRFRPYIQKGDWQPKLDYHLKQQLLLAYP